MLEPDRILRFQKRTIDQSRPLPVRLSENPDRWLRNNAPRQPWAGGGGLPSVANETLDADRQRPFQPDPK